MVVVVVVVVPGVSGAQSHLNMRKNVSRRRRLRTMKMPTICRRKGRAVSTEHRWLQYVLCTMLTTSMVAS